MKFRHLGLASLFCLAASTWVAAQTSPLFRADFSAGAAPRHGFASIRDTYLNQGWSLISLPGAGPGGRDAVEIAMRGVSNPTEHYVGWYSDMSNEVPQGAARYIRMKIRLVGPIRYESVASSGSWSTKMVILGDGGQSNQRVMWNLRSGPSTTQPVFVIEKNIDGGNTRITTNPLPVNEWIAAQLKIQSSSTTSSGNARLSLYLGSNNASESTPSYQSGSFSISTADWDMILGLGYYCDYMRSSGNVRFQFAAFEYSDRFDPTWHLDTAGGGGGGSQPPPAPPSGVRIVTAGADALLAIGAFSLVFGLSRRVRRQRD